MSLIPTPTAYAPLDMVATCKNWTSTPAGTSVRMGNRAAALQALAEAVNRCLGRYPRIHFQKCQPLNLVDSTGSDPLYLWRILDNVDNARNYTVRILALPRVAGSGNSYAGRRSGTAAQQTQIANFATPASVSFADTFEAEYPVVRGGASDARTQDGLSTFNGYTVISVVVQDDEIDALDTSLHEYADIALAKQGEKILADVLEQIRDGLHKIRTTNLPCWGWAAMGSSGSWATPASTDGTAIVIPSATYVNVLDQTVTSRTATSPGSYHLVQNAGWGRSDQNQGKQLKLMCEVLASATGGTDAQVKFIGPDHLASNDTTITVTAGAAVAWYGSSSNFVYLNPASGPTDVSTERNKVDVHARLTTAPTQKLYIYGVRRWIEAP